MADPQNVTREGVEVKVGQVWKDLDPRFASRNRTVTITAVEQGHAFYEQPRRGRLAVRRMHKHSTGWALVQEAPNG